MDGATVTVAVVSSRAEADLIVGLLGSNGVAAVVSADDAGAQEPELQVQGVRVLVAPADEAQAISSWPRWTSPGQRAGTPAPFSDGKARTSATGRPDRRPWLRRPLAGRRLRAVRPCNLAALALLPSGRVRGHGRRLGVRL